MANTAGPFFVWQIHLALVWQRHLEIIKLIKALVLDRRSYKIVLIRAKPDHCNYTENPPGLILRSEKNIYLLRKVILTKTLESEHFNFTL